jgi:broad specificity phosphatase PhoE
MAAGVGGPGAPHSPGLGRAGTGGTTGQGAGARAGAAAPGAAAPRGAAPSASSAASPVAGGAAGALLSAFGAVLAAAAGRSGGAATAAPGIGVPAAIPAATGAVGAVPAAVPAAIPAAPGIAPPTQGAAPAGARGIHGLSGAARPILMAGADAPARAALAAYGALPFLAAQGRGRGQGRGGIGGADMLARLGGASAPATPAPPGDAAPVPGAPAASGDRPGPGAMQPPYVAMPPRAQSSPPGPRLPAAIPVNEDMTPASLVEIGLLRHFPTDWNAEGRLQGRTDVPLSGASVAALLRLRLPPRWRDLPILSSPLSRAAQTARILAETHAPTFDDRLLEMDFGAWEGRIGADLIADPACRYGPVETWGWDFRAPDGESPAEMLGRVAPVLTAAAAAGPCLIVCHRGLMRAIMAAATGWPYLGPEPFRIRRARVHPVMLSATGIPVGLGEPEKLEPRE